MSMERAYSLSGSAMKREAESGPLIVEMAFASDRPYERWWGIEVLDMSEKSVRLERLNEGDGGSVLFNHNWDDLRGRHEPGSVRVEKDGFLRGRVIVSPDTQVMRDTIAQLESKTLSKASVGYQIHRVIEQTTAKSGEKVEREIDGATFSRLIDAHCQKRDGRVVGGDVTAFRRSLDAAVGALDRAEGDPPVYRVVDWEPLENSFVTVPADNGVGVGRALEAPPIAKEPEPAAKLTPVVAAVRSAISQVSPPAAPAASERKTMTVETQAAAGAVADTSLLKIDPLEVEKQRKAAIGALCRANKIDARVEAQWVNDGTRLEEVAAKILDVVEERGKAAPTVMSDLGMTTRETNRFSLFRAIRALRFGSQHPKLMQEAAYELECSRAVAERINRGGSPSIFIPGEVLRRPLGEAATRAMATTPGSKGGYMVNVENMGFIDILRNRSVSMALGARVLSGLTGNVMFPRQTGKVTVTWQAGENVSVTAADQALGQLSMNPKTCIAITDVSEQLLRQASPSAEAFVMADLARDVAIDGVDNAAINGTGGAQPLGVKNTTGVTSGQDAASVTYAKMLAFPVAAGAVNAIRGNPGFVTNITGASVLMQKQRFSSTDTPVWEGDLMDGTVVGFRAMSSEQLASGNIIFGSWDELVIGEWGVLELATDNGGTRFNTATVGIRAMWMVDVMLRYPQAFVVSTNLAA